MTSAPLLRVPPSMIAELKYKMGLSGITLLKQVSMRTRYCGNKHCLVDINGKLWLSRKEFKQHLEAEQAGKKEGRKLKPAAVKKLTYNENANLLPIADNTENLYTPEKNLSTKRTVKENRVNKREVRQRILAMINSERGKKELYFWTVTFPQGTSDDVAFQMYNIWLTSLRKYKMLKNYIWVAERQQNGTIHYHIAIPHKMNVHRANAMMQGTLKGFAKKKLIPFHPNQCKRYNGVDIAKNRNTKRVTNFAIKKGSRSLTTYLTKYIAKNDGSFSHLAWHNSRGYSSLFTAITLTQQEFEKLYPEETIAKYLHTEFKAYDHDHFFFMPWVSEPPGFFIDHLRELNSFVQSKLN